MSSIPQRHHSGRLPYERYCRPFWSCVDSLAALPHCSVGRPVGRLAERSVLRHFTARTGTPQTNGPPREFYDNVI
jgi:hypothetical protein